MKYILFLTALLLAACGEPDYTPKPRGYPRVDFPERAYQAFDTSFCDFTFEYPTYTRIVQDTSFFEDEPVDECWFDIFYPGFDGRVYFSYYPIDPARGNDLETLRREAFEMADWHNKRANYIEELRIQRGDISGIAFAIEGPAASPFQFFLTDSTRHFLRGALYFNTQVQPDSMAPIIAFAKEDILHLIETFRWKD